jgi:hypothetical protein
MCRRLFANGMCRWLFCERHVPLAFLRTARATGFLRTARASPISTSNTTAYRLAFHRASSGDVKNAGA